jgi:hypothetical protein
MMTRGRWDGGVAKVGAGAHRAGRQVGCNVWVRVS